MDISVVTLAVIVAPQSDTNIELSQILV